jgi:Chalcone isomerase-like
MNRRAWLAAATLVLPTAAFSADTLGFAERTVLDGQPLLLNGAGLRKYGVFGIEVYAAALYLDKTSNDADTVLDSPTPKVVQLRMLRGVSREDSIKAWRHYLAANCTPPCRLAPATLAAFEQLLPAAPAGQRQSFVLRAQGLELIADGQSLGRISDSTLARVVLASWIGAVPTTAALKDDLLGANKPR